MERIPFNETELTNKKTMVFRGRESAIYAYPIPQGDNLMAIYNKEKPLWLPGSMDGTSFTPRIVPDIIARGFAFDGEPLLTAEQSGGPDMFGTEWIYVPSVGGSMVKPGNPRFDDVNDWRKVITFPDVDSWDWEGSYQKNKEFVKGKTLRFTFMTGFFERLISFMDFEGAVMALIDEDQQDAVHDLFQALTDLYKKIIGRFFDYYPEIKLLNFHDDWGSQRAPFFSLNTLREMLVPYIRQMADFCHEHGRWFDLHSCGSNELNVPGMIEAHVDSWAGQPMNDKRMLFKKYGKQIILSIDAPEIACDPNATPEQLDEAAKEFVDFCLSEPDAYCTISTRGAMPLFCDLVYKYSRIALNS